MALLTGQDLDGVVKFFLYKNLGKEYKEEYLQALESPSEKLFFVSFYSCLHVNLPISMLFPSIDDDAVEQIKNFRETEHYRPCCLIVPQGPFADYEEDVQYRVDFAILGIKPSYDENFIYKRNVNKVIVECDGNEFHEKTKEQVIYEKKRDRFLQSYGLKILRFSGSEICSDPFGCAEEVKNFLFAEKNDHGKLTR